METPIARSAVGAARVLAVGGALLLSTSCALERRIEPTALPAPVTQRIPLTVGVHYSLEFKLARPISGNRLWKIGDPSVKLFSTVLPALFENVVEVETWPPRGGGPDVAGVIVPRVTGAGTDPNGMHVNYQVELFSRHGERIGAWEITGSWTGSPGMFSEDQAANMRNAVRSAGAALIASFFREPDAQKWRAANGISPETPQ